MKKLVTLLAGTAAAVAFTGTALAEKWDMPMAYSASNFHSTNGAEFAKCVTDKTGGKLEIVTHPGGSLFKGGEIKRAIQTGQAPIGERLLSAHANENPVFGIDSVPFLATSFDDSVKLMTLEFCPHKSPGTQTISCCVHTLLICLMARVQPRAEEKIECVIAIQPNITGKQL